MTMPGRTYTASSSSDYRYGFNGKEMDNEPYGQGNEYDYGFRIYNPRVGRFLSIDPLTNKFPWYTPYQFAGNKPIWAIDMDGLEDVYYTVNVVKNGIGQTEIQSVTEDKTKAVHWYNHNKTGELGDGILFTYRTETQDMDGKPLSIVSTDVFVPKSTWLGKLDKLLSGDESGSERYGYVIYGKDMHNMDWQKKLPKAGPGSESIDMGEWLDYVGGQRETAAPTDLLKEGKLKDIIEKIDKVREGIDKTQDFVEKINNNEAPNTPSENPIPTNPAPVVEPRKKLPPLRKIKIVDTIPGVSPQYDGPWTDYRGSDIRDTIIEYKKKSKQ